MSNNQEMPQIIFVLGPPGAGKTYLCQRTAESVPGGGFVHVVMSDLLRAESEKPGSPWAEEIKQKMSTGALVSKEVSTAVLRRFVDELPRSDGKRYFLDGFPRNLEQAMAFDKEVGRAKGTISLTCSVHVLDERRAKRARHDDTPEIAEGRYQSYLKETVPAIEFLKRYVHEVAEVSSDKDGDEGWHIFLQATGVGLRSSTSHTSFARFPRAIS